MPTLDVVLSLIVSLPPQMARYLKDVFGPRVAPLMGMTADELFEMKHSMSPEELAEALTPRVLPLTMEVDAFIRQLDEMDVERAVIFNLDEETPSGLTGLPNDYYADLVRQYPDRHTPGCTRSTAPVWSSTSPSGSTFRSITRPRAWTWNGRYISIASPRTFPNSR